MIFQISMQGDSKKSENSILASSKALGEKRKLQAATVTLQSSMKQKPSVVHVAPSKIVVSASPEKPKRVTEPSDTSIKNTVLHTKFSLPTTDNTKSRAELNQRHISGLKSMSDDKREDALTLLSKRTAADALLMREAKAGSLLSAAHNPAKLSKASREALVIGGGPNVNVTNREALNIIGSDPGISANIHQATNLTLAACNESNSVKTTKSAETINIEPHTIDRNTDVYLTALPATVAKDSRQSLFMAVSTTKVLSIAAADAPMISAVDSEHGRARVRDDFRNAMQYHANDMPYENYVRKNLKKSATVYKKQQKDPRYNKKSLNKDFRNAKAPNDAKQDGLSERDHFPAAKESNKDTPLGFASTGMDTLQMTLDVISRKSNGSAVPTAAAGHTMRPIVERAIPAEFDAAACSNRGKKSKHNPHGLTEEFFEKFSPMCNGHQMRAKLLTVKKAGPNRGRRFYRCGFSADQQCNFFMWADDNPDIIPVVLELDNRKQARNDSIFRTNNDPPPESLDCYEAWKRNAVALYLDRLDSMTAAEIKAEVVKCKRRRLLTLHRSQKEIDSDPSLVKLQVGGLKADIISRLGKEAMRVLEQGRPESCPPLSSETINISLEQKKQERCELGSEVDDHGSVSDVDGSDEELFLESESEPEYDTEHMKQERGSMKPVERALLECFGFSEFRQGQQWAMQRALDGLHSMLVMPTGAGKSLCYMLPACLLPGLTVVVSPLISLMQDQLRKLPVQLPGACFGGGMSVQEVTQLTTSVLKGFIKVLFVSPEKLCTVSFRNLMKDLSNLRQHGSKYLNDPADISNPISLVCIDEAHCMSQWSYNFRPTFLRIRKEIAHLKPRAIMALTATAPPHIQHDVMAHLRIPLQDGLCVLPPRRINLSMYAKGVEMEDRHNLILALLKDSMADTGIDTDSSDIKETHASTSYKHTGLSKRKIALHNMEVQSKSNGVTNKSKRSSKGFPCTIIYVWRRDETESLCDFLQASGLPAVAYHAGMDAEQRSKSQQMFNKGTAKIVIATTAFGMGVDKADVRQVIHGSLPKSVENYLQETGRAGRDGKSAACHLLLCPEDLVAQYSLSFSNRLSVIQVASLLSHVFMPIKGAGYRNIRGKVPVSLKNIADKCDIADATVETILSVLELPPYQLLLVEGIHLDHVHGSFKVSDEKLAQLGQSDIIIKALLELRDGSLAQKDAKPANGGNRASDRPGQATGSFFNSHPVDTFKGFGEDYENEYKKLEFQASLMELAEKAGLDRAEAATGLYMLQKRGILAYTLSDACVYITLTTQGKELKGHEDLFSMNNVLSDVQSAQMNFCAWLFALALQVTHTMNNIEMTSSQRICDAWRIGRMLTENSRQAETSCSQGRFSDFLCFYMDRLSGLPNNERKDLCSNGNVPANECDADHVQSIDLDMLSQFMAVPIPVVDISEEAPETEKPDVKQQRKEVLQDAQNLTLDTNLKEILAQLEGPWDSFFKKLAVVHGSGANADKGGLISNVLRARTDLLAMYISKIMHGLSTPAIASGSWKSNLYWAKYKNIDFQSIFIGLSSAFCARNNVCQ